MIDNKSEKNFRDNQINFGHLDKSLNLTSWLQTVYNPQNLKLLRYKKIAENFLQASDGELNVLEVGSGVGDFIVFCSSVFNSNNYFANDLSEKQLSGNINEVMVYFKVNVRPQLSFTPVENLDFQASFFDVVFVKASVHHFENPSLGFSQIYKVLKPGGKLVFFEDPVCLDIPLYRGYIKKNFCLKERSLGINENIYTIKDYFSFGRDFLNKKFYLDEELVGEFDKQQQNRRGLKKVFGYILRNNILLFNAYMIFYFKSPLIFVFTK